MYLNPAGLMAFRGTRVDLAFELFQPDRTVLSSAGPAGSGSTTSKSDFVPIPAFAWSSMLKGGRVVVGLAGLGIGGFGVDYPVDPTNPVLAPRPFGFGQVYSNYQLMKIMPSLAFKVSEKLWLGASLNVDWASLAVDPFPVADPDVDPGPDGQPFTQDDRAFYPSASAADGAFGLGFQVGFIYRPNDLLSIGGAYTSTQKFDDFEFNATHANPNLSNFGTPYPISFGLDVPAVLAGGVALTAMPNVRLMGDVRYIFYENTDGFSGSGFTQTGAVKGFGWQNILVLAGGVEIKAGNRVALRGGWNHSDSPIPGDLSMFNVPAPGIVQDHLTLGFGIQATRRFGISAAYYHAFENRVTGPFQRPTGPLAGTSVSSTLSEDSFLVQFSVGSRGEIF